MKNDEWSVARELRQDVLLLSLSKNVRSVRSVFSKEVSSAFFSLFYSRRDAGLSQAATKKEADAIQALRES
jgi:hypothetical protein